jgi:hypothetical protein
MPASTPRLVLPYPIPDDTVDVPRDIQALATRLDNLVGKAVPMVTSLPAGPAEGDEIYLRFTPTITPAQAPSEMVWHLRCTNGWWLPVGSVTPIYAEDRFDVLLQSVAWTGYDPTVVVPFAGDYLVNQWTYGAASNNPTTGSYQAAVGNNTKAGGAGNAANQYTWMVFSPLGANYWYNGADAGKAANLAAGDALIWAHIAPAGAPIPIISSSRSFTLLPLRLRTT